MKLKIISFAVFLFIASVAAGQTTADINKTDSQGKKQGHWIKKYPNGNIQYEGTFKDDKPVGEFKRFYENKVIKSILIYSSISNVAEATIYHTNGFISSKGKYVNQLKEGKWKFFSYSIDGCLINEEEYTKNLRNGLSLKYYPDSTLAEKINFANDVKEGEWLQYHPNGKIYLKAFYSGGQLNGKFEAWYDNGKPEYSGNYKNDMRDGAWKIYNEDGTVKYVINYVRGTTDDPQMDKEEADFFDKIERNKGKIADPEKTGVIR
jgi:antitoxin component YwqK of YwqJK toxin-antitoxin module